MIWRWCAIVSVLTFASCGQRPVPPPPVAPPPHRAAVMVQTWIVSGQPPSIIKIEFSDFAICETARLKAVAAGDDARFVATQRNSEAVAAASRRNRSFVYPPGAMPTGPSIEMEKAMKGEPVPSMSAVCLER